MATKFSDALASLFAPRAGAELPDLTGAIEAVKQAVAANPKLVVVGLSMAGAAHMVTEKWAQDALGPIGPLAATVVNAWVTGWAAKAKAGTLDD